MILEAANRDLFLTSLEAFLGKHPSIALAAEALGVTRSTIYLWRKTPCLPDNPKILTALQLSLSLKPLKSSKRTRSMKPPLLATSWSPQT